MNDDNKYTVTYHHPDNREQKLWELYKQCANGLVYATDLENSAMLDLQTAAVLLKVWEAGAGEILADARAPEGALLNNNKTEDK
jgi:hypothetical protein